MNNPAQQIRGQQTQLNANAGHQSGMLVAMNNIVNNGGNISHILNVKVSNEASPESGHQIRLAIFARIANVPLQRVVNDVQMTVTWRTLLTQTSAYYYTDVNMFTDLAVRAHTTGVLTDLIIDLQRRNPTWFGPTTGLAMLVSKPLQLQAQAMPVMDFLQPMQPGNPQANPAVDDSDGEMDQ